MVQKAMKCKTADELLELAKAEGFEMTKEEAEEMFNLMYSNDKLLKIELEQDYVRFIRLVGGKSYQGTLCIFFNKIYSLEQLDWYYSKHFDVRGLIPLNLAIEVTDKNNPYERID